MTEKTLKRNNLLGFESGEEKFGLLDVVLIVVILFLVASMLIQTYWLAPVKVEGSSMMQTLQNDDWLFMDKLKTPSRGDVVVFEYKKGVNYIKRVIGLPGDEIYTENGKLFLKRKGADKAEELVEDYAYFLPERPQGTSLSINNFNMNIIDFSVVVEEGKIFVLGDNRWVSKDSRDKDVGQINLNTLIGVVPDWAIAKKENYAVYLNFIEKVNGWFRETFVRK